MIKYYKSKNIEDVELIIRSHICACSTNIEETTKFGISKENVFGFWDFVGGRFSVWSAIGVTPLSIHFGFDVMEDFFRGGHHIDRNFVLETNVRVRYRKYCRKI